MSGAVRIDLEVPCGDFALAVRWQPSADALGVFGPSGAGKTSLLEAIAGLRPTRGRLEVAGKVWLDSQAGISLPAEARGVGLVPQEALLFPHLDVLANAEFGAARARRAGRALPPARVLEVLDLGPLARRPVTALSGGEQRRVALARALCSGPEILLLDEPLAGLDRPLRRRVASYLLRVREEFALPTIYVSHEPSELLLLTDETCVLAAGAVVGLGASADVLAGASGAESGPVTVLTGTVLARDGALVRVELGDGVEVAASVGDDLGVGSWVALELAAAEVILGVGSASRTSAQNHLHGVVAAIAPIEARGAGAMLVAVNVGTAQQVTSLVSAQAAADLKLAPGVAVEVIFKAHACRLVAAR